MSKTLAERLVPQWVARGFCAARRHPQVRYSAWKDGKQVVVYTCRCGARQDAKVYPANRKIRRFKKRPR